MKQVLLCFSILLAWNLSVFGKSTPFIQANQWISEMPPPPGDTLIYQLPTNNLVVICLEPDNPGPFFTYDTITCSSPLSFGTIVSIDQANTCFTYASGAIDGVDVVCVEYCDGAGSCEVSQYTILINDGQISAEPDTVSTTIDTPVLVDALNNDVFIGETEISIVSLPSEGAVVVNGDNTLTYTPALGFCGVDDFIYQICAHPDICDITQVVVNVGSNCEGAPIEVYNSFSPNGDNINDVFVVEGLGGFPDHVVKVFNRWGVLIYEARNYDNSWRGDWNGKDLPDGTYFYLIEDGNGTTYSGYLQLHR